MYIACRGTCSFGKQSAGCHVECISFVPPEQLQSLMKAIWYQYEPSSAQNSQRTEWMHSTWSSIIATKLHLPIELCNRISQYSIQTFALSYAIALLSPARCCDTEVKVSDDIWARYTFYEGEMYIASLTNEQPHENQGHAVLISKAKFVSSLFIVENHLGIRDVWSTSSGTPPSRKYSNAWWRRLDITKRTSYLRCQTDVSLRYARIYF